METLEQVITGKEEEELNRGRGTGEKVRKEMLCSGGLARILYALSVTCRSLLIIERGKVRAECEYVYVCLCGKEMQRVKSQRCLHSTVGDDKKKN